jgi:branched-chain amino acid transport system permease protein
VPNTIGLSQARWGLAAVALAALPVVVRSPYARHVILIALIFAFVALGLNLIFGYAGQHAFGHPVFFGVGAYASALFAVQTGWPVGLAVIVGAIVTAIIAAAVGYPCFRLRGIYFGVATFAFARVIYLVAQNWVGLTRGPMGILSVPPLTVMPSAWTSGVALEARLHVVLVALLALTLFLLHRVIDSPIGRAWIAIRENEALATSVGIHPLRYKMAAFAGGGLLAGVGGGLYAHYIGFVSPSELGFHYIGIVFIMLIGGGTGTLLGPVVGALVFGVLPEVLRLAETARNTLLGGILLLSIAFLPEGLVGLWGRVARRRPGTVDAGLADGELPSSASELVGDGRGIVPAPSSAIGDSTLEVRGVTKRFGGLTVLHEVTFNVRRGEIVGLIGPNGAGKTTLFNIVTGFLEPTAGEVRYGGRRVSGRKPAGVAALGITRTFQITSLFPELTVADNVRTAAHTWAATGLAGVLSRTRRYQAVEEQIGQVVDHVLALTRLSRERRTPARALSYGAQRNLEMAVAIATRGRLLLLDEPAAGLNPEETGRLRDLIVALRARGTTILVIEHDMRLVMEMCDRIVVLNYGEKIAEGAPKEIVENPRVVEAYLGTTVVAGHA